MKTQSTIIATTLLLAALTLTAATTNDVIGDWRGTLDAGSAKLRLVFHVKQRPGAGLAGTMDSIDQGARGIPVESVRFTNSTLRMEVKSVNGVYEGTLDASGKRATGNWSQGGGVLPLVLEKGQGTNAIAPAEKLSAADQAGNKLAAQKLAGVWNGDLSVGQGSLRLRVNISKTAAGTAMGTMDSLDQGATGIPLSALTLKAGKVHFEARGIGGSYEGTLAADDLALTGQWQQGGQTLPLNFKSAPSK